MSLRVTTSCWRIWRELNSSSVHVLFCMFVFVLRVVFSRPSCATITRSLLLLVPGTFPFGGVTVNLWMGGTSPASTSDRHSFFSLRGQSPVHYSWFQWIPLTECSKKLQTIDWVMSKAKIWLLIRFSILLILNLAVSCLDRVWAWWPSEPRARMAWAKKKIVDRVWASAPRISSFWKRSIT